jgi:uncharacterized membrane protein
MAPLIVLVASFILVYLWRRDPIRALSWALAAMFLLTASAHFGSRRDDLVAMVPPVFPAPGLIVTVTGVLEILGAIGLVIPRFTRPAALCLGLLLLAMFPANVHAAREGLTIGGDAVTPLVPHTLMQLGFLAALAAVAFRTGRYRSA